jgi:hypothetical protein
MVASERPLQVQGRLVEAYSLHRNSHDNATKQPGHVGNSIPQSISPELHTYIMQQVMSI